jgi:hypothetical protein
VKITNVPVIGDVKWTLIFFDFPLSEPTKTIQKNNQQPHFL